MTEPTSSSMLSSSLSSPSSSSPLSPSISTSSVLFDSTSTSASHAEAANVLVSRANSNDHILSIAPMIQWTDRYWRYLFRQISQRSLLYTEMTMDAALLHNLDALDKFIGHDRIEHPLAIQLGGNDPMKLGEAAYHCENYGLGLGWNHGFEEINLNCGCPSNKAKRAGFGAELMLEPELVRQILQQMKRRVSLTDVTVKCRLGVTGRDSWDNLTEFILAVKSAGVSKVIVHARHCVLRGLTPAQNRTIPPLRYDWAHRLVETFPDVKFVLNGGITTFDDAIMHLGNNYPYSSKYVVPNFSRKRKLVEDILGVELDCVTAACSRAENVFSTQIPCASDTKIECSDEVEAQRDLSNCCDVPHGYRESAKMPLEWSSAEYSAHGMHGVMIGREAYHNPFMFATADDLFYGVRHQRNLTRRSVLVDYLDYAVRMQAADTFGSGTCNIVKPLHNFFYGSPGNSNQQYKQRLDDLLKVHVKKGISNIGLEELVMKAVDETIPRDFLDASIAGHVTASDDIC